MNIMLLQAIGGVGLFLLGMFILTDGLRELAGNALRSVLRRSTRSPVSGAIAGALMTALLQSSSATTVATVGFVGAGLIAFPNALGIIFGANIGTTMTGWLVAILGFKLHLGTIVTPLVLIGALMRIFAHGRWRHAGWALAGFSLLFIGIDAMQQGMAFLREIVSPTDFPGDSLFGRLQLVFIGIAITLVTQSSSAGVAIALSALSAGAISFPQAAAMVIGMDVGTTFTAVLATVGGSTAMRRTGYAHVIYNALTGTIAFILLVPLTWLLDASAAAGIAIDPQLGLVAFHSSFNLIGVLAVIGFTNRFAALVIRLVPERGPRLTARLDDRLLSDTGAAVDALTATVDDIARAQFALLAALLDGSKKTSAAAALTAIGNALDVTKRFSEKARSDSEQPILHKRYASAIHTLDHLVRLHHRNQREERVNTILSDAALAKIGRELADTLSALPADGFTRRNEDEMDRLRSQLRERRSAYREKMIAMAPDGETDIDAIMQRLDGMRWLHRVAYHLWRIIHHLRQALNAEIAGEPDDDAAIEADED